MVTPELVISYWLDEVGPTGWYAGGADLDAQVRALFEDTWHAAQEGALGLWLTSPAGSLAYLILTDQMPRNMFRDTGNAFASDASALAAAKGAIARGWDMHIPEPERQFFYMPLEHSEHLNDQDRCVRLMCTRLPETGAGFVPHACAHRNIIRKFGRFPTRNAALGRASTDAEVAWLKGGGYAAEVRAVDMAT